VACVSAVFGGIQPVSSLKQTTGHGAGLTYALYSIFGKYATRTLSPTVILPYILGFGALFTLVALPPSRILSLSFSPGLWAYLAAGGLLGTFIPYLLYTTGLTSVPASNASIVAMVEPAAAAAWGWWLLGESLTPVQLLGGALVLGAASLARWKA
jgi:DME family drug/metabolite transporter